MLSGEFNGRFYEIRSLLCFGRQFKKTLVRLRSGWNCDIEYLIPYMRILFWLHILTINAHERINFQLFPIIFIQIFFHYK